MPRKKAETKQKYISAVGRRREAVARVRLYKGKGETVVNNQPIEKYFPGKVMQISYQMPFELTGTVGKYYATVLVSGGGKSGQLQAVVYGLSRALALENKEKFRPILKKANLLSFDARVRERRKVGMGGKARRKKQSPKR